MYALQQAIDAEIKSLEDSLRVLKLRCNALSPVSSLPPEVFAAIFSLLCLPGTSSLGGEPDLHLARLRVSHVCHQWREITLNQPLLWSYIDFTILSMAGAAEILVRAKSVPLYLEATISGHRWGDARFSTFREELQARVRHIRYLRTSAEPVHLQSTLKGLVSPAPTLEYLSLSSRGGYRNKRIGERPFIPDTLFSGSAPRLSCLELCDCNISWESPLMKGLKYLEILTPSTIARPKLGVWLSALNEMPQLETLTLHSASPIAPPIPPDVARTVTLPSLARLDILASPGDCALALAHLDLPALTWLCLTTISSGPPNGSDVQKLLPYLARHAHGPQDTQPLQSLLVASEDDHADILAWPLPDINVQVHDTPTLLAATLPTRLALSFRSDDWPGLDAHLEILDMVIAGLPLDGLVTLAAHDLHSSRNGADLPMYHFLRHLSPKWPLLQRVRLGPLSLRGFMVMLLEDKGGREKPLLPSLIELVIVDLSSDTLSLLPLCKVLTRRVEQGVPLEMLDLRMCIPHPDGRAEDWLQSLSGIIVNVLGPEKTFEGREQMKSLWKIVACGPFANHDNCHSLADTDSGDEDGEE
jgi:hypothetical protein